MLSSGLTQFELRAFSKIKVVNRLIVQAAYANSVCALSDAVVVAFVASALSAIAAMLSYSVQSDDGELRPALYRVEVRCDRLDKSNGAHRRRRHHLRR